MQKRHTQPRRRLRTGREPYYPRNAWQPTQVRQMSHGQRFRLILKARFRTLFARRPARIAAQAVLVVLLLSASVFIGLESGIIPGHNGFNALAILSAAADQHIGEPGPNIVGSTSESQPAGHGMTSVSPPVWTAESKTVNGSSASLVNGGSSQSSAMATPSSVTSAPSVSNGATESTAGTTVKAAAPAVTTTAMALAPYENVTPSATTFPGIDPQVTRQWLFPMTIEPSTPGIGVFGATRSNQRSHAGIDLYAPPGTKIYAMTDGTVRNIEVFYQSLLSIEVENLDGTTIRYTELDPLVKIGDRVVQGQQIAKLRRNYDGTCMLHLEVYATLSPGPLTDIENNSNYLHVVVGSRSFRRRSDLVDPSAVYTLRRS